MKYTIGIDLGGTNIAAGLCDDALHIIEKGSVPTNADRPGEQIVRDMAELCKSLLEKRGLSTADLAYVGIAAPGSIDPEAGIVEYANNLPFEGFPIVALFRSFLPVERVFVANDANAAALGEALAGAGQGADSLVMITLGTGVGGGVILGGKIFAGGVNAAGTELGHTVIVHGGRQCSCGRRGCWEAYSSATALSAMTEERLTELRLKGIPTTLTKHLRENGTASARTAFDAMRDGDPHGARLVEEYIGYLAEGVTNMINIFQPEVLCIGGGVCNEKNYLLEPLLALVAREQYTRNHQKKTEIRIATLGNDAGIIGAAGLGLHN